MGQDQSQLNEWVNTVTADQIHPQLTKLFLKDPELALTSEELTNLRATFNAHIPKKSSRIFGSHEPPTWNKTSFTDYISRYFPPDSQSLASVSTLLFILTAMHATYPFTQTDDDRNLTIDFNGLLRAVVLLSSKTRNRGALNRDTIAWVHDANNDPATYQVFQPGRSGADRRRLLFQSLMGKPATVLKSSTSTPVMKSPSLQLKKPLLKSASGIKTRNTRLETTRNEDCEIQDMDMLDVLSVIQPLTGEAKPVLRTQLKDASARMPRGLSKQGYIARDRLRVLLSFLAGIRVVRDVVRVGEVRVMNIVRETKVDEQALKELLDSLVSEDRMVYAGKFEEVIGPREEEIFGDLYKLFDLFLDSTS